MQCTGLAGAAFISGLWSRPYLYSQARPDVLDAGIVVVVEGSDAASRLPFTIQRPPLYLAKAKERGLGETDVGNLKVETIKADAESVSMFMPRIH